MTKLVILKVLILIRQVHLKIVLFFVSLDEGFKVQPAVWNGCHDVVVMSIDLNSICVLNIHEDLHGYIIIGISK